MRRASMRATFALLLVLFGLCNASAVAPQTPEQDSLPQSAPAPWIRFSRYITQLITGSSSGPLHKDCDLKGPPAPRLLSDVPARSGGAMVVRFNLTTPEEASTLAETATALELDVWDFVQEWADIRIATDLVRLPGCNLCYRVIRVANVNDRCQKSSTPFPTVFAMRIP
jgi:hypothetical protein